MSRSLSPCNRKGLKVAGAQGCRGAGDHFGELAQRFLARSKVGAVVIMLDVFRQFLVVRCGTEILPVGLDSIKAVIGPRYHGGQHLALGPGKPRRAKHRGVIHLHGGS